MESFWDLVWFRCIVEIEIGYLYFLKSFGCGYKI